MLFRDPLVRPLPASSCASWLTVRRIALVLLGGLLQPLPAQALTWDLGVSVPYLSGRMQQFLPLSLELGLTSVKGYGVGYNVLTSGSDETLQPQTETTGTDTYESELTLQSGTLELYYRFEQYVHRWDVGVLRQATQYEVVQTRTTLGASLSEEQTATLEVTYLGPFVQYSNTWIGYDEQDAYYALQLAWLSRSTPLTETPFRFDPTQDSTWQAQQTSYQQFVVDHNPESSVLLALTIGWRL